MKNISLKRIFIAVALICFTSTLVAQFTMPASPSDSQYNVFRAPGLPLTLPTTSFSNAFTSQPYTLQSGQPLSVWWYSQGSNGASSNVVGVLRLGYGAPGSTNYATTPDLRITNTLNGTNQVLSLTYFTAAQLLGARTIIAYQISNTNTNILNVGSIIFSQFRNQTGLDH